MTLTLHPVRKIQGAIRVPGDKSISHRSLIFGAIAEGTTEVTGLLNSADVRSTESCLSHLGTEFTRSDGRLWIKGRGLNGLRAPQELLDCGNSGTTTRILMGLLAGQLFKSVLTGDESIQRRPMKRAAEPLRKMGARIELTRDDYAPITISGQPLKSISHELKVASAQVKTALLIAGLYADGVTTLTGQIGSRDHTERLLPHFGVQVTQTPNSISIGAGQKPHSCSVSVPGDPSSAAFWMAAASMIPGSQVKIENISLNPTRTGFLNVLQRMGANIEIETTAHSPEPIGSLMISHSKLHGTTVTAEEVPSLIDEIPMLAVIASQAEGETRVSGAQELRVKESDRIDAVATNLRAMGVTIETFDDGFSISGKQVLRGARIDSYLDHRIAMSFAIASLVAEGPTEILNPECVGISYPEFFDVLRRMT